MFKNFFKTTYRNLLKNKAYTFLNIFGLGIGIACAALIFLWVEDETSYNNVNVKKDKLYEVMNNWPFVGHYATYESTPGLFAPAIKAEIPGVANAARSTEGGRTLLFRIGDKTMYSTGQYADSAIFSMFTMPFVQGSEKSAFIQPYSLVITEKAAKKYFGTEKDVIGKVIKVDEKQDYVVTGIIKDFPENTSYQFEWVAPFDIFYKENQWLTNWDSNGILTFVELKDNANIAAVNKQVYGMIKKRVPGTIVSSFMFGMNDWHLRSNFENGKPTGKGQIQYVHMFSIIAWIILFLACINFMNLATARSEKRAREVGVRKVLGSGKKQLILQFIGEALVMAFLSAVAAIIIVVAVLPLFNLLAQKQLTLSLDNPIHFISLLAITLICGLVAGSYPSLYLSSFNPVFVLKGLRAKTGSASFVRKGLVIMQFTVSIVLIIGTVIIFQQIQHIKSRELGFDKNNLLSVDLQGDMGKNFNAIKQELLNTGVVESAALTDHETIYGGNNTDHYTWKGKDPGSKIIISNRNISPGFLKTNGIKIIQGRDFNANPESDSSSIIITESLAKMMNMPNVIGQKIYDDTTGYPIVGVVNDYVYGDLYGKPDPVVFACNPHYEYESNMYVRLKPGANREQALAKIEAVVKKDNPAYPPQYRFVDDQFEQQFQNEALISKLSRIFATLAIIISCLGLFGLAAYTAERRIKEIGIRKVLGASVTGLASLLSVDFLKLVLISSLAAFPIAWWLMHSWLQSYAYRITINLWVFLEAAVAAMLIAIITISFQSIKAALMNPIGALKNE